MEWFVVRLPSRYVLTGLPLKTNIGGRSIDGYQHRTHPQTTTLHARSDSQPQAHGLSRGDNSLIGRQLLIRCSGYMGFVCPLQTNNSRMLVPDLSHSWMWQDDTMASEFDLCVAGISLIIVCVLVQPS